MSENRSVTLPAGHEVHMAFSGVAEGNMDMRFGEGVAENRRRIYERLELRPQQVAWMIADHGNIIYDIKSVVHNQGLTGDAGVICDGLITTEMNRGLALFPGDCIPMAIFSSKKPVLGLIHVGRAGAEGDIHTRSVQILEEAHGVPPTDVRVYLGPSIKKDSYRYPELDPQLKADKRWDDYITWSDENQSYHLDLVGFVFNGLIRAGLDADQIAISDTDTAASPDYFSHRRHQTNNEPEGRNGMVVVMKKKP